MTTRSTRVLRRYVAAQHTGLQRRYVAARPTGLPRRYVTDPPTGLLRRSAIVPRAARSPGGRTGGARMARTAHTAPAPGADGRGCQV
ncbi:hypothetical protein [Streptomyces tsukubensis]|uniref:hypothetical protein n=1 Tax=Streptomyces tsukubensis TaxID=83656 RepID=UPI001265E7E3|nr:hypothetical protein [Streptomyces tsukubensis]QFR95612.1 hypothetical protein GBW32_24535 [Streptomyces tsukubensis]